jgi:pilus assembly protein CpaF
MADVLLACVRARFNLLVVGSGPSTSAMLLSALALAVPAGERVVVLQDEDEIALPDGQGLSLWTRGQGTSIERLGAAVCRLGAERVLVGGVGSPAGLAVIDAIEEGCDGVIAAYSAPTLARGIARLASRVSMTRVGVSTAVARDALIASFDIGIEVARDARGHLRVRRIAELSTDEASGAGIVDIFVSTSEGGAWSFTSTGASQRITHELAARGVPLEPTTNRAD